jgi:mannose-6-phosphate isomerase-like protein (cupin superfamily)
VQLDGHNVDWQVGQCAGARPHDVHDVRKFGVGTNLFYISVEQFLITPYFCNVQGH